MLVLGFNLNLKLCAITVVAISGIMGVGAASQHAAAEEWQIPDWVSSVFGYYAAGQIPESTLLNALEFLIQEGILQVDLSSVLDEVTPETPPTMPNDKIPDEGDFYLTYMPNPNSLYTGDDTALAWLKDTELLETKIAFLNENFRLPYDVEVVAKECEEANAFYEPETKQIIMCYEYVDYVFETWDIFNEHDDVVADYVYAETTWTFYHEVAHAIIDIYALPITGIEENVADQFATYILSLEHTGDYDYSIAYERLSYVILNYQHEDEYLNVICPEEATTPEEAADCLEITHAGDAHGLNIQRAYNTMCYLYGADPVHNQHVEESLPEDRAIGCEHEYWQIYYAWGQLLRDYTNGFFDLVE